MANKKFKFTDLSDELFVTENSNDINNNQQKQVKDTIIENDSFLNKKLDSIDLKIETIKEKDIIENKVIIETIPQNHFLPPETPLKKENIPFIPKEEPFNKNISKLIEVKEKLEVKTNIYLKSELVKKIKRMCDETGNSRSAIINKLLEFAIKEFE